MAPNLGLTADQISTFHRNGYLIIPDALSPDEVSSLLAEKDRLLATLDVSTHPMTRFTTGDSATTTTTTSDKKHQHVGDDYFLSSGDKIRFFFEPSAFSAATTTGGKLLHPPTQSINKIGHYLHVLSPPFRATTLNARNAHIAASLGFREPRVLQSMVICKQARIGGAVPPHQDSEFLFTEPPSAVGWWYALQDCWAGNGCLGFVRGSHVTRGIRRRFVLGQGGRGTEWVQNEGSRWPGGVGVGVEGEGEGVDREGEFEDGEFELGEVKAGTLVLIHGNVVHRSEGNGSEQGRAIYTFHCIEGENEYDGRNWLQPPEVGFSTFGGVE